MMILLLGLGLFEEYDCVVLVDEYDFDVLVNTMMICCDK